MREETKRDTLRHIKRNLDEYFEDLDKGESDGKNDKGRSNLSIS